MEAAANFIVSYFASKNIYLLSAFLCWRTDVLLELHRIGVEHGIRVSVHSTFDNVPALPAYDWFREGVLVDMDCPGVRAVLNKASNNRAFIHRYSWLLLHNNQNQTVLKAELSPLAILPDADVVCVSPDSTTDVYRIKPNLPFIFTKLDINFSTSLENMESVWRRRPTAVIRRKNLQNVYLPAAVVLSQPHNFLGWSDLTRRHIDTFPKLTYPLMMLCAEDLKFRYNMRQVEVYGTRQPNGSFDGAVGLLQRGRVQIAIASIFLRQDRAAVMHYCSETVELRGAFMFRQPPQSAVSNVFLLPFSWGVWAASGASGAVAAALLTLLAALARRTHRAHTHTIVDPLLARLSVADAITFAIGAICQQGFHVTPGLVSARLVMVVVLLASMAAFTSYSAKIVALLQTPSNAIQTLPQLARSPLKLAVQDTTYKSVYFAESKEPATQALYRHKLQPQGDAAYLSVVDGIAKMRTGLFAFQVEQSSGYDIISKTFTESEKCGLKEIQAFKLPMVAVAIVKHSGYRELLASRLRWQRETGMLCRWRRVWMAARVACGAEGTGGFVSVAWRDTWPALQVLLGGATAASALLVLEIFTHKMQKQWLMDDSSLQQQTSHNE